MEQFVFDRAKANYDAAYVEIDITEWLESETIQAVTYSAVDSSGADATAEVLDLLRSNYSGTLLLPYVKGGINLEQYTVLCRVDTLEGNHQEFRLKFNVREAP